MPSIQSAKSKSTSRKPSAAPLARLGSKLAKLLALIQRPQGATIDELAKATGWQKHTVRGAISGSVKKKLRQHVKLLTGGDRRAYAITRRDDSKSVRTRAAIAKQPKAASPKPAVAKPAAE